MSLLVSGLVPFLATPVSAQLEASFRAESVYYYANTGDCDTCFACTPTCELYFSMGVWSGSTRQGDLYTFPAGCGSYDHANGFLNFPDQTIVRSLPNLSSSATFYFAMFDEDPLDDDDLLGLHTRSWAGTTSATDFNNDLNAPSNTPVSCSGSASLDDDSAPNRFQLTYDVWFSDATGPTTPGTPAHSDTTAGSGWDDDTRLDFSWSVSSDPHSGVSGYQLDLRKDGGVISSATVDGPPLTVCAAGCDVAHAPADGSSYTLSVKAINGDSIGLLSPTTSSWSSFSAPVTVDQTAPATSIVSPSSGSWQANAFSVEVSDLDAGPLSCEQRAVPQGSMLGAGSWIARVCNTSFVVTVGPAADCSVEGVCDVHVRATDAAGNSQAAVRQFGIDFSDDSIGGVSAATESGGEAIENATWTNDTTPYLSWAEPVSTAPITGYSWALETAPDCVSDTTNTFVDFGISPLSEGPHPFEVRALDSAGNCGPTVAFSILVDVTADAVTSLTAASEPGGAPIDSGVAQDSASVELTWQAPASTSPIAGYSYGVDIPQDCDQDTTGLSTVVGPLSNGSHDFWVRAIDSAGNCGAAATFEIVVETCFLLELHTETITGIVEEASCSVAAGPDFEVADGGELTIRYGESLVLKSGFSVASGGVFRAIRDPSLLP